MPTMASITVKKFDGVTDIIYDALSASGGDGSPAVWRQDTGAAAALPVGLRQVLKLWSTWNGPKTARQMKFNFVYPYATQDTTTTVYSAKDKMVFEGIITMPQNIPAATLNEVYQLMNLLSATLVKSSVAAGYAPT
ncbi:TPA_asm: coat protein [ssRNA phage Gephyllon.4_4]|uniref:Coat protein n=2 Tax=unclassified Fiersviridae TaxID=2852980 RepID=A0A8S5KYF0_9VIRU|nr:coat protein [ssRNA phage Gephyllon.4_4]QDH87348.1 MAG: hypothetical protein H4BulkLitter22333_000003 [Leviviridae sp.]DAD50151.1 TPA_asm: coat protein [ssRNA phage Gephyllon.4_4]